MDLKVIGAFLAKLRKDRGMTQEALGETLGVSGKTVSRWETGVYLPPVEMLEALSKLYGLTINELLAGRTLGEKDYPAAAEETIKSALRESAFSYKDRVAYFTEKWKKEHFLSNLLLGALYILAIVFLWVRVSVTGWIVLVTLLGLGGIAWRRNQMMSYVEAHSFDGRPVAADNAHRDV